MAEARTASSRWLAEAWLALGLAVATGLLVSPLLAGYAMDRGDARTFFGPLRHFYANELARGRLAFWMPQCGLGYPVYAESQLGQVYPPNVLLYGLLPTSTARATSLWLHLWWGGLGMAWLLRFYGARWAVRAVAALGFSVTGTFIAQMPREWIYLQGAWVPWAVLAAEHVMTRRRASSVLVLGVLLGVPCWIGHYQVLFLEVVFLAGYGLVRRVPRWRHVRELGLDLTSVGAVVLVAALVGAVQVLPTWHLKSLSVRQHGLVGAAMDGWFPPHHHLQLLLPGLFNLEGGIAWRYWQTTGTTPYGSFAYVGVLPILGLVGLAWAGRPSVRRGYVVMTAVVFVLILGELVPGMRLVSSLPGFSYFRGAARWGFMLSFCLLVLGSLGLDGLIRHLTRQGLPRARPVVLRVLWVVAMVGVVVAAGGLVALTVVPVSTWAGLAEAAFRYAGRDAPSPGLQARLAQAIGPVRYMLGVNIAVGCAVLGAAVLLLLRSHTWAARAPRAWLCALVVLQLVDMGVMAATRYPRLGPRPDAAASPVAALLARTRPHRRVITQSRTNSLATLDINNLNQYFPALLDKQWQSITPDLRQWAGGHRTERRHAVLSLVRASAVHYVVANGVSAPAGLTPVWAGDDPEFARFRTTSWSADNGLYVRVFAVPDPLPPAYLVRDVRPVASCDEAIQAMNDPAFDVSSTAVVTGEPIELEGARTGADAVPRIVAWEPRHIRLRARVTAPSLLVVSSLFTPGWTARVDGHDVDARRSNLLMTGIPLEPGTHAVELSYTPPGFALGATVSAISLALVGAWFALKRFAVPASVADRQDASARPRWEPQPALPAMRD